MQNPQTNSLTQNDYYPFGMQMPGRSYSANSSDGYGFGFNGKLKDDDIEGDGNSYDFGARIYDPRISKFLSIDPLTKKYPYLSPYSFVADNPITLIDIRGQEIWIYLCTEDNAGKTNIEAVQYKNGSLYTADGKEYKGDNEYANLVKSDLTALKSLDQDLSAKVNTLETSPNKHYITMTADNENFDKDPDKPTNGRNDPLRGENDKAEKNEKGGVGSISEYNPYSFTNTQKDPKERKRHPLAELAHELLGHGYNKDQAKVKLGTTDNGINLDEVEAVKVENVVRAKMGDTKREHYGDKKIPEP